MAIVLSHFHVIYIVNRLLNKIKDSVFHEYNRLLSISSLDWEYSRDYWQIIAYQIIVRSCH